jgi:hypothetical protein
LDTWTRDALSSEARPLKGTCWRLVEAQHRVSTLKLVDTLAEQALLEDLLEKTKPPVPPECRHLHYLLATPFRYGAPYPKGSRFRRAGFTPGVYYASEQVETAVAEIAFHRLRFFAESPALPWPSNALELTAFSVRFATGKAVDLMQSPLSRDRESWVDPIDYGPCQRLADEARGAGVDVIRSESARRIGGANIAILTCRAFAVRKPISRQSWRLRIGATGIRALCDYPEMQLELPPNGFPTDPRLEGFAWNR